MRFATLSALLVLAPALAAADDPMSEDKARFQGTWNLIRAESEGEEVPADHLADDHITFEGEKYFVKSDDEIVEEGTFTLRPDKSPREIDLKILKGDGAGSLQLGLYKFDGENLVLAVARRGSKDRPKIFRSEGEGAAYFTSTVRRESE